MNKRGIEKAIKILNPKNFGFSNRPEYEALNLAISALEQQIPKKRYIKFPYSYCPVCNENITDESPNYCPECGQAIDWGNEDEIN